MVYEFCSKPAASLYCRLLKQDMMCENLISEGDVSKLISKKGSISHKIGKRMDRIGRLVGQAVHKIRDEMEVEVNHDTS